MHRTSEESVSLILSKCFVSPKELNILVRSEHSGHFPLFKVVGTLKVLGGGTQTEIPVQNQLNFWWGFKSLF